MDSWCTRMILPRADPGVRFIELASGPLTHRENIAPPSKHSTFHIPHPTSNIHHHPPPFHNLSRKEGKFIIV